MQISPWGNSSTATVIAGRSTQFMLNVVPSGGFANSVSFSCTPVPGNLQLHPAVITPPTEHKHGADRHTSSSVVHFGF